MTRPKQEHLRIVVRTAYDVWMTPEPGNRTALIKLIRARAQEGTNPVAGAGPEGSYSIRRAKK